MYTIGALNPTQYFVHSLLSVMLSINLNWSNSVWTFSPESDCSTHPNTPNVKRMTREPMIFIFIFFFLPFQLHQNPLKPIKSPSLTTDFILFLRKSIHGTTPFLDNYTVCFSLSCGTISSRKIWNYGLMKRPAMVIYVVTWKMDAKVGEMWKKFLGKLIQKQQTSYLLGLRTNRFINKNQCSSPFKY